MTSHGDPNSQEPGEDEMGVPRPPREVRPFASSDYQPEDEDTQTSETTPLEYPLAADNPPSETAASGEHPADPLSK
jgi:hypothetical protein